MGVLLNLHRRLQDIIEKENLGNELVEVVPLTSKEAIGDTARLDFPILKGKEVMIEASFRGSLGQAFTSYPGYFKGSIRDLLKEPPATPSERAFFVAAANALLRDQGLLKGTLHCRDKEPEECARGVTTFLERKFGVCRVALIGLQPALLSSLAGRFPVRVTDLDPNNIGQERSGVTVESAHKNLEVMEWADTVLATGTTLTNDTVDQLLRDKPVVFYGVTIAGAAALLGYDRYCPCAH